MSFESLLKVFFFFLVQIDFRGADLTLFGGGEIVRKKFWFFNYICRICYRSKMTLNLSIIFVYTKIILNSEF